MKLNWEISKESGPTDAAEGKDREQIIHRSMINCASEQEVQSAIDASIAKACELLERSVQDDSRYLLFGWAADTSTLTVVVTDDDKVRDSEDVVLCRFVTNDLQLDTEDIQFWIKDYLTTCSEFLRYSLIAAFHQNTRATCTLL
ncbi:hypothetical protein [uncultured Microbulbifer sp.]|uniref:hypothetical protein n=1 Tax=uncultured Microbulbifer sp. TaxID=348147 RepID=UPI002637A0F6|nr:hypothetical protein [uncultured Microbulbifer sp.]